MILLLYVLSVGVPLESRTQPREPVVIEHREGYEVFKSEEEALAYVKEHGGYPFKYWDGSWRVTSIPKEAK